MMTQDSHSPEAHSTETGLIESRFDPSAWLVLLAALMIYAIAGVTMALTLHAPSDGWITRFTPERWLELIAYVPSGQPTPLREGDVVTAINGVSLTGGQRPRMGSLSEGQSVPYTILRDGQTLEVRVPLVTSTVTDYVRYVARTAWTDPISLLTYLLMGGLSLFVFFRRPGNQAARILLLLGSTFGSSVLALGSFGIYSQFLQSFWLSLAWNFFGNLLWVGIVFPSLIALPLAFPTPKRPMRSRWFVLALYGLPTITCLAAAIQAAVTGGERQALTWFTIPAFVLVGGFVVVFPLAVIHSFRTITQATERAQMRWFTFGVVGGLGGAVLVFFLINLINVVTGANYSSPLARSLGSVTSVLFLLTPISLAIAILRYRLFDIDLIIRRTLQYSVLSGLLALVYFGLIVVLQGFFTAVSGQRSAIATVLSTLTIAALFLPLRRRVQTFIDKRFYRQKYDAQKVLAEFAATARDETDLDTLTTRLVNVVQETMQPEKVTLWLKPTEDGRRKTTVPRPSASVSLESEHP